MNTNIFKIAFFCFICLICTANVGYTKNNKELLSKIDIVRKPTPPQEIDEKKIASIKENGDWAVETGSFSNYIKAKNFAKKTIVKHLLENSDKHIEIKTKQVNSALVYKPIIIGFTKDGANNLCNSLKKTNNSCTVIENNKINLVYKKHE